jgi:hypothetical protein
MFMSKTIWRYLPFAAVVGLLLSSCGNPMAGVPQVETPAAPTSFLSPTPALETPEQPPAASPSPSLEPIPTETAAPAYFEPLPVPAQPIPMPLFGTEADSYNESNRQRSREAGFTLMRRNALRWSVVEPKRGDRNWGAVASFERELIALAEDGIESIVIVRDVPAWAQEIPGYPCGPIKKDELIAFASFVKDAVERYSTAPFKVRFWEMGNEPDVDPFLIPPASPFGCWGDEDDPYYGGRDYAEMLKVVYPAVKGANPEAQVLNGGLLLDCDPTNPPEGKSCLPAMFLEGVLANGGGDFFDIVSFHGYHQYWGSLADDEFSGPWGARGGVVLGRLSYLQEVLDKYDLQKPFFHTEGGLLCPESSAGYLNPNCNPVSERFLEAQADYVVWLYVRNWAAGIQGTIWYMLPGPGWRNGGLLYANQAPRPSFVAFQYLRQTLADSIFIGSQEAGTGVRIYEFRSQEKATWVAWSPSEQELPLLLPAGLIGVYDKYGLPLEVLGPVIQIKSPVYIEFIP